MKKHTLTFFLVTALIVTLTGCMTPEPVQEGRLYVRTLIDGQDTLYIRGDSIWIEHQSFEFPGKLAGRDLPTYINQDQQWVMEWNGTLSNVVTINDPKAALPMDGVWNSENMMVKFYTTGFGEASVVEYPTPENMHTLVIDLDDFEPRGAHWFYIDIDWDETSN